MDRRFLLAILSVALFAGADWTAFRGPGSTGVSEEQNLPTTWSATENLVWKTPLPGFGSSSPITLADKVFVTCYSGYGLDAERPGDQSSLTYHVLCIDRGTGEILWDKKSTPLLPETEYDGGRINLHGYASSTPVTDGQALYVFFGKSGVMKYGLDGQLLWKASVGTGLDSHDWGSGASLVLAGNLLIINASAESKSIRALNKESGEEIWRVDGIIDSWSTPVVVTLADGSRELVVIERLQVLGLDPATGKKLWICNKPNDYVCPSVIAHDGVVYVINSRFKAMLMAIRAGGRGDVTDSHVLWTKRWTTRVSTPIYYEGHLYAIDQAGVAYCIDAETGEELYGQRLEIDGYGDKIYASVVAADGKIYGVTRSDGTVVLALSPQFRELARNYLGDPTVFNATPAIVDSRLLLRSDRALYCIGAQ